MTHTSRVRLETFVGFLQEHGILPQATRFSFEQQARLQKCAFIAQIGFGMDLGYDYHLHEYGTFSSFLGADFVRIIRKKAVMSGAYIPLSFKAKRFLETVSGRKIDWLCVATVAIHEMRSCDPSTLQSHVEGIAIHYDRRLIRQVLKDIEAALLRPGAHINTVG